MFADDTSLFSKIKYLNISLSDPNDGLETINQWTHQWKIWFNLAANKQATEMQFYYKINFYDHPNLSFNDNQVQQCSRQIHLGLVLDNKLASNKHLYDKIIESNKRIVMMKTSPCQLQEKVYWPFMNH